MTTTEVVPYEEQQPLKYIDPIITAFVNQPDDPTDDPINVTDALFAIAQAIDGLAGVIAHLVPDEARR